jgi:hypothetical protein
LTSDTAACFVRVQATLDVIGLDWSAMSPPPGAPCDQDRRLAMAYYDTVFDDRQRATAQPAIIAMMSADANHDERACLISAAMVRQSYVDYAAPLYPPYTP